MKSFLMAAALAGTAASLAAQTARPPDELLDRMAGRWILEGTIVGKTTIHDVDASRVRREAFSFSMLPPGFSYQFIHSMRVA